MNTAVTTTERVKQIKTGISGAPSSGNGPKGNGPGGGNGGERRGDAGRDFSPHRYRVTLWVLISAIAMMFASLVFAYIMLWSADSWRPVTIPRLIWLSTALIIASSLTFESARRSLKQGDDNGYSRWLLLTLILGLGFLTSQLFAWRQLVKQGIYMTTNPHSSFFYLLTGAHGLHLLGGILALNFLLLRTRHRRSDANAETKRQAAASAVSIYWHFMDGLWVFLFLLLLF
ncbi:MAG TPA: cytochrome c oxidase subunit 3 [Pyrinomonadaceae bacterium]|nr:cytochrome c oxidase subunit 3 [Pyrinomonadaceae bacterium]